MEKSICIFPSPQPPLDPSQPMMAEELALMASAATAVFHGFVAWKMPVPPEEELVVPLLVLLEDEEAATVVVVEVEVVVEVVPLLVAPVVAPLLLLEWLELDALWLEDELVHPWCPPDPLGQWCRIGPSPPRPYSTSAVSSSLSLGVPHATCPTSAAMASAAKMKDRRMSIAP
jgi:hypothetical protein